MKIGQIKAMLNNKDIQDFPIYFDFCQCIPTRISSWRGIYSEPAIGWDTTGYGGSSQEQPRVSDFLKELMDATDGRHYTGWKGGEYQYTDKDTLHVDNPGNSTDTEIVMVEIGSYSVTLHTRKEDD